KRSASFQNAKYIPTLEPRRIDIPAASPVPQLLGHPLAGLFSLPGFEQGQQVINMSTLTAETAPRAVLHNKQRGTRSDLTN
ncbi:hypothetical protein, partial [Pseudomonas syringae group genomosp. 7]|uniref:hypothetical protein n=1 Tax=Pseudomonas syringae group genomosp. 7 TaxID=251699 RepID=UPI00376FE005